MGGTEPFLLFLAALAGIAFSFIGLAYRAGAAKGIPACQVAVGVGLFGVLWFGWISFGAQGAAGPAAPPLVWIWGIATGLAQGFCVYLYRVGLKYGPFAPLWCAGNLFFVTPAFFSLVLLGESLNILQVLAMLVAGLCVVTASAGEGDGVQKETSRSRREWLPYLALLSAMVILTGLCGAGLKHLASVEFQGHALNPRFSNCFMLGMYGAMLAWVVAEAALFRGSAAPLRKVALLAAVGGAGSVTGMALTAMVSRLPGGIGFAVITVSSVLAGSLITSFGFGERRTPFWWATVGLAILAVLLFNLADKG